MNRWINVSQQIQMVGLILAALAIFVGLGALAFAAHVYYFRFMLWFLRR